MKAMILLAGLMVMTTGAMADTYKSPDGHVALTLEMEQGKPCYQVSYDGQLLINQSPLGIVTNIGDYSRQLTQTNVQERQVSDSYDLRTIKQSHVDYVATEVVASYQQEGRHVMDITFRISNRDVAFRYTLQRPGLKGPDGNPVCVCVVKGEASSFVFPEGTTTFLCPQVKPMGGFARTYPSYETPYTCDEPVGKNGWGEGYTFPCLFRTGDNWVLLSETGTDGGYVGCRLLNTGGGHYQIGFPQEGELNGLGSPFVGMALPASTPWRTITVGPLKHIVETTVPWDLVEQKYKPSKVYEYGKGTWSWIIRMDSSCNYDEQKEYIDFSAAMGWQTVLVDAHWDLQIGYERVAELARYARSKGVSLFLWYNSNGYWNDAPQTPKNRMSNSRIRRQEMKWLQENGIRGIKVDFFAGDKQPTLQLYEDILSDANDYGLLCIFHGCTLPRGWERMFPNYVASEAVLASENLSFGQAFCDAEARNGCIHPFIRNTVGSMDFGGSALNKRYSTDNQHGTYRRTSDVYALATAVLFQSAQQHFALAPNNLTDAPAWAIDFMKKVPTMWDEVRFIDGYPGKYIILARRSGERWFVAGINAGQQPLKRTLSLPMFAKGTTLTVYADDAKLQGKVTTVKQSNKQQISITIPQNGGVVVMN